jgi:DNA-binding MarR family transcriptional regulator
MKLESELGRVTNLLKDAEGCYFDERIRAVMGGDVAPAIEAIAAVRNAARQLHLIQERWAESQGLSEGRLQLLFYLRKFGESGVSLGRLADLQRVSPRNITGLVDNLEKAGLVERVPDAADRRSIHARLTPNGRALIESIWKPALDQQFPLSKGFSQQELVQLRHLCLKLLANAMELQTQEDAP